MNWLFAQKQSLESTGVFRGFTDWHCHILPGVDDGVQTLEESLAVLDCYSRLGIREVWLTPHVMEDVPNTPSGLRTRFARLQAAYRGPVVLHLAAEHMLDNLFEERLEQNDLLPIGPDGTHLLVETSYFNPPMRFNELLSSICRAGYLPLLAHPERYLYMSETDYRFLHTRGIEFQLNLPSLVGAYGPEVQRHAEWLLKEGMVSRLGTDLHSLAFFRRIVAERTLKRSVANFLVKRENY